MAQAVAMTHYLYIALGGALGSMGRYAVGVAFASRLGSFFPWATLTVNVAGSFLIGLLAFLCGTEGRWTLPEAWRLFFLVGLCGGFTTFSSFSLQTLELLQQGESVRAFLNVAASVIVCLAAVFVGYLAARWLNAG